MTSDASQIDDRDLFAALPEVDAAAQQRLQARLVAAANQAGLLDVAWAISMKYAEGYTRPGWSVLSLALLLAFVYLLGRTLEVLPVGTAYAVWTGIGAVGTAALGMLLFGEPAGVRGHVATPSRNGSGGASASDDRASRTQYSGSSDGSLYLQAGAGPRTHVDRPTAMSAGPGRSGAGRWSPSRNRWRPRSRRSTRSWSPVAAGWPGVVAR